MDKLLHEIWVNDEGLTGLVLDNEEGDPARKLYKADNMKLVHTFYASSYFEAMNIYNAYCGYGEYTTPYVYDKLPYSEWKKIKGPWK